MGYDKTRGLGRDAQGPTKIIEESKQKGHRGLGYTVEGFNDEAADWDFDTDPVNIFIRTFSLPLFLLSITLTLRLQLKKKFIGVLLVNIQKILSILRKYVNGLNSDRYEQEF